jgi:hypothetical protein
MARRLRALQVVNRPLQKFYVIASQTQHFIVLCTKQSADLASLVVMVDTKVLPTLARIFSAANGTTATLGRKDGLVLLLSNPVAFLKPEFPVECSDFVWMVFSPFRAVNYASIVMVMLPRCRQPGHPIVVPRFVSLSPITPAVLTDHSLYARDVGINLLLILVTISTLHMDTIASLRAVKGLNQDLYCRQVPARSESQYNITGCNRCRPYAFCQHLEAHATDKTTVLELNTAADVASHP